MNKTAGWLLDASVVNGGGCRHMTGITLIAATMGKVVTWVSSALDDVVRNRWDSGDVDRAVDLLNTLRQQTFKARI